MGIELVAFPSAKYFGFMVSMIWELRFIIQWQLYYATTLAPNEGNGAVKNFRNHNVVLNEHKTIHQVWESLSLLGLHSTGCACGFLCHIAANAPNSLQEQQSGQRDTYGGSSSSWGTLSQPTVQWPEKYQMSLSSLPDLKQIHSELSQQKTSYCPLTSSSEEAMYRIPFICSGSGCHSPCTYLGIQTSWICLPSSDLQVQSIFYFSFPCLLGWQLLLLEFYGMWQLRTPFSPGTCQADRGQAPEHPGLICGRSATAGSDLSHAGSDRARLWLQTHQASQGWPAAVNTFVLR